jgi:peptidyl-prolyl cis-trans isomerase B (cyclophilin B)
MKIKRFFIGILIVAAIIGILFLLPNAESNKVKIQTSKGDIIIELNENKAPITVANFKQYIEEGFYDGTVFHRVIDNFMVQGGGFDINGNQKTTNPPIELESDNGLKNEVGTIAMARTTIPNSATSQFFINVNENDFLNYGIGGEGYAVFGKVIEGMDVINEIKIVTTGVKNGMSDWPLEEIIIIKIELI